MPERMQDNGRGGFHRPVDPEQVGLDQRQAIRIGFRHWQQNCASIPFNSFCPHRSTMFYRKLRSRDRPIFATGQAMDRKTCELPLLRRKKRTQQGQLY